jgi:hypothetical protein
MKRVAIALLFAGAVAGCTPGSFLVPQADTSAAKSLEPARMPVAAPVTASQITAANAQEKAQAMRRELDRDMEQAIETNEGKK